MNTKDWEIPRLQKEGKHTSFGLMVSSTIAGTIARTCTHPFERLRIMQQTIQPGYNVSRHATVIRQLKFMYSKEGMRGLFKGNMITCVGTAPFTAIEFFMYDFFKNNLFPEFESSDLKFKNKLICGAFAGICAQLVLNPWDVIKVQYTIEQQTKKGARFVVLDKARTIHRKEGLKGFYKGNLISMMGAAPFIAIRQSLYDFEINTLGNQMFTQSQKTSPQYLAFSTLSGAVAGFVAVSVCYPFDVLRKRMQLNRVQNHHQYRGVGDLIMQIYNKEGIMGFTKGYQATSLRVIYTTALLFMINDQIKQSKKFNS